MTPDLPGLPQADGEPIFSEPWEAQAFALVVGLHERGAFTWTEWADVLSAQIHSDADLPYYQHWLQALERIVADKDLATAPGLAARKQAWLDAADRTPHGQPITI